jgi:hypothetical protein
MLIDPRILEDIQRALHLKARREARLKALQNRQQLGEPNATSDKGSLSSFSTHASPVRMTVPEPLPIVAPVVQQRTVSAESDIDFSPSVGAAPIHPVPSSSDGGATLDWTASASEDERDKRWPLLSVRRPKDKTSAANRATVENQEVLYSGTLSLVESVLLFIC